MEKASDQVQKPLEKQESHENNQEEEKQPLITEIVQKLSSNINQLSEAEKSSRKMLQSAEKIS